MDTTPIIGILGGIGAGKSTVAAAFARLGCGVIDADAIAHTVLDRPPVITAIAERFGPSVLDGEGRIDRRKLALKAFERDQDVAFLNGLIHPPVLAEVARLVDRYRAQQSLPAVVLDVPLLLEAGQKKQCDVLIFVECEPQKRLERTLKKGKIDETQLKKREKFQISLDKKKEIAHYIIYNNSDESDVAEQVAQLLSSITNK